MTVRVAGVPPLHRPPAWLKWLFDRSLPNMRLLHTSDWHLGQHFMGKSRQAEHQSLIDWLVDCVATHRIDAVLIAGDLFDTGTPPSHARELYNQLVLRLHHAGVALLLLGGNHDSPATLSESRALLAQLGATVIPAAAEPDTEVVVLRDRNGDPGCIVCAVPYIRPRDVLHSQSNQSAQDKQSELQNAITEHYRAVYAVALDHRETLHAQSGKRLPIIATGHLTTIGASSSESVREIYVGTLEAFPATSFPPVEYVALGHIHRPQQVGRWPHIRYSGSPLALSFDEADQVKSMLCVELGDSGLISVTPVPVPRFRPLTSIRGSLATLPERLKAAATQGSADTPVWVEVTVSDDDYLSDLAARIEAMTTGLAVEVLRIRKVRDRIHPGLALQQNETLDELTPTEVFVRRLAEETLEQPLRDALVVRFASIVEGLSEQQP